MPSGPPRRTPLTHGKPRSFWRRRRKQGLGWALSKIELGKRLLLLGLTNTILNLTTVPAQDNIFISCAHSHVDFHSSSNCWVCRAMPLSVMDGLPWWVLPLRYGDFIPLCSFLKQQKGTFLSLTNHNISLLSWCKKKPLMGWGHRVTFNMNTSLTRTYTSYMKKKGGGLSYKRGIGLPVPWTTLPGLGWIFLDDSWEKTVDYSRYYLLRTKRTQSWIWRRPLDLQKLKYMGYLSPEQCKQIFEVTYHPNWSVQWPGSKGKYNPKICWVARNGTQWLCGLNLWP